MNALIPLIAVLLLSKATATPMPYSSPEPVVDPFPARPQQELYITPAGRNPSPLVPLTAKARNEICRDDYPDGFSVRCIVPPTLAPDKVLFRVSGSVFRTERVTPYYLAGDVDGLVYPFKTDRSFSVGCDVGGINVWAVVALRC